ncbi:ABC transporter [Beijerinckiaceae bacterium]|nr:ABC transporter [Beijerinckiaceae bacterium]
MIELRDVSKTFGGVPALSNFSLKIESGAFFTLVGPSGCGKSTVLRLINAMIIADSGHVEIDGRDIREMEPERLRRGVGYVIQSVGLFPHWTIAKNILAVPHLLKWSPSQCAARLDALVAMLQIDPSLLNRYPRQLSGGQQQRIGVARALAADPNIILMDEPFAALDPVSRLSLQEEIRGIHAQSGKTIVFVTHDMDEALRLATNAAVINGGRLIQSGTPAEILSAPADDFVCNFLGGGNLALRLLDLLPVRSRLARKSEGAIGKIEANASLRDALNLMLARQSSSLCVIDEKGEKLGEIHIGDIVESRDAP